MSKVSANVQWAKFHLGNAPERVYTLKLNVINNWSEQSACAMRRQMVLNFCMQTYIDPKRCKNNQMRKIVENCFGSNLFGTKNIMSGVVKNVWWSNF